MSKPRWQEMEGQLGDLLKRVDGLGHRQEELGQALMMSDPSSVVAAEAYEGLRRQVVDAAADRMAHLAQLVQFTHVLANTTSVDQLRKHVDGWMEQAGLDVVDDVAHPATDRLFDVLGGEGDQLELIEPAYVDARNGRVIRQGRARRVAAEVVPADPEVPDVPDVPEPSTDQHGEESA